MYNANLENQLISVDIPLLMQDYTSIQLDIDESKIKAAAWVAQRIDLKAIGKKNIERCREPQNEVDEELRDLVIPAWCYFTYYRSLRMFQGTLTDGGFSVESDAESTNAAKTASNTIKSIAEEFLKDVLEFINAENPQSSQIDTKDIVTGIRVFGGKENRGSN